MRFLLNSHIPVGVAKQLRRRSIEAHALSEWMDGNYRSAPDELILATANSDSRILVTYDCQTIPPLLKVLAEAGQHHAGVILVDEETIRPDDIGGLVRALERVSTESANDNWEDHVLFLAK